MGVDGNATPVDSLAVLQPTKHNTQLVQPYCYFYALLEDYQLGLIIKSVIHSHILYNDKILPSNEAILYPGQVGLFTGWGVFTTLRIYEGVPFSFEQHRNRLERDAGLLNIKINFSREKLRKNLCELVERNECPEATMRVNIMRSQGGMYEGPGSRNETDILAFTTDLADWGSTMILGIQENARHADSPFAGVKTLSWAFNLTFHENARSQGYDEVVLLNERHEVAECTSANIFTVRKGVIYTPPVSSGLLTGITRHVMLHELDEEVKEMVLQPADLYEADEVFITSSSRELLPVERIMDTLLKGAKNGWPVMERVRTKLRAYIADYIRSRR